MLKQYIQYLNENVDIRDLNKQFMTLDLHCSDKELDILENIIYPILDDLRNNFKNNVEFLNIEIPHEFYEKNKKEVERCFSITYKLFIKKYPELIRFLKEEKLLLEKMLHFIEDHQDLFTDKKTIDILSKRLKTKSIREYYLNQFKERLKNNIEVINTNKEKLYYYITFQPYFYNNNDKPNHFYGRYGFCEINDLYDKLLNDE